MTAEKRAQRAFDVPISLAVITSEDLQRNAITNISDLQFYVPGLWVESSGAERRITINGVSNTYGSGSLVGVYLDDADETPDGFVGTYGYGQFDTRTYDMARVEVLRGPQGTLYGEGSMGGAIHFVTNRPVLTQFEMSSDVAAELTQHGAPSQRIDMMLNTPLVENTLGLRVVGQFEHQGGWIDEPAANAKNYNEQNLVDVRAEGLWRPTSNFTVNLMQIEHRNSYGIDSGEDSSGNYTQTFSQTTIPHGQQSYDLSNATLTYDFSGVRLLSSTTYFNLNDPNIDWSEILPFLGINFQVYFPIFQNSEKNTSEELRLSRTEDSAWQWTVGYFYKHFTDATYETYYFGLGLPPGTDLSALPLTTSSDQEQNKSSSVFADTSYELFKRLTIGAGVRYFRDDVNFSEPGAALQATRFSSTDPRVYVRYAASENVNVYASAAKGFRPGGFNSQGQPPYEPERVWTYDLGTKMRALENRLTGDLDFYVSNYSNYDIVGQTISNPSNITRNAGTARIKGVNADLAWRPSDQWSFGISGDYIRARFVSLQVINAAYNVGDPLPATPEYLLVGTLERDFHWLGKPAFARFTYSQVGPSIYFDRAFGEFGFAPVLHLLNFNTGVQWNDSLRLSLYAQNLTNDRGYLDAFEVLNVAPRERPRTLGVEFTVNFQ